jgi:small subunit ribosomal protein S28e
MAIKKDQKVREGKSGSSGRGPGRLSTDEPVNAEVLRTLGRTGARGEVTQVECKILAGKNEGKSMRRNVKGSVRIGDLLVLRETEIEARRIKGATKGAHV